MMQEQEQEQEQEQVEIHVQVQVQVLLLCSLLTSIDFLPLLPRPCHPWSPFTSS